MAGGIPEAVTDGESAVLVPIRDPRALAGAMGRILGSEELAARLGAAASRTVDERYDAAVNSRRVAGIYESLLAGRKGRS